MRGSGEREACNCNTLLPSDCPPRVDPCLATRACGDRPTCLTPSSRLEALLGMKLHSKQRGAGGAGRWEHENDERWNVAGGGAILELWAEANACP